MSEVSQQTADRVWRWLVTIVIVIASNTILMAMPEYEAYRTITKAEAEARADIIRARALREAQRIVEVPCLCQDQPEKQDDAMVEL